MKMIDSGISSSKMLCVYMCVLVVLSIHTVTTTTTTTTDSDSSIYDYCVIGAGPGGLQLGYYLQQKLRNYIILESSERVGNFFVKYPKHRLLISINKKHSGQLNSEYQMRHDWNSLLSDDSSILFRNYSKDYFPQADVILDYLSDYKTKFNLKVRFNSTVEKLPSPSNGIYHLQIQDGSTIQCRTPVVATGVSEENVVPFPGVELTVPYSDISTNPDDYEGKSVLIIGFGNSAFETAEAVYGHANSVRMVGRTRVKLSWNTHYVGDLRAVNSNLLDSYQLKSLDTILELPVDNVTVYREGGKLYFDAWIPALDANRTHTHRGRHRDGYAYRYPVDIVITCLGFHYDSSIFDREVRRSGCHGKFPLMRHNYESADIPGVFFTGAVTHSLDHKKSSGGFIHGFRYTSRALSRLLDWRNHGDVWPSRLLPFSEVLNVIFKRANEASGLYQMFGGYLGDVIAVRRGVNDEMMFEYYEEFPLCLMQNFSDHTGHSVEDFFIFHFRFHENSSDPTRDTFTFDRVTDDLRDSHHVTFLHPVLHYFKNTWEDGVAGVDWPMFHKQPCLPRPSGLHIITGDAYTLWDSYRAHHLLTRRFIENTLGMDMTNHFADECFKLALEHTDVPLTCKQQYLHGNGYQDFENSPTMEEINVGYPSAEVIDDSVAISAIDLIFSATHTPTSLHETMEVNPLQPLFVLFGLFWDPKSKLSNKHFNDAVAMLPETAGTMVIDCYSYDLFCRDLGINVYPVMKVFRGQQEEVTYPGLFHKTSIYQFIKSYSEGVQIVTEQMVPRILNELSKNMNPIIIGLFSANDTEGPMKLVNQIGSVISHVKHVYIAQGHTADMISHSVGVPVSNVLIQGIDKQQQQQQHVLNIDTTESLGQAIEKAVLSHCTILTVDNLAQYMRYYKKYLLVSGEVDEQLCNSLNMYNKDTTDVVIAHIDRAMVSELSTIFTGNKFSYIDFNKGCYCKFNADNSLLVIDKMRKCVNSTDGLHSKTWPPMIDSLESYNYLEMIDAGTEPHNFFTAEEINQFNHYGVPRNFKEILEGKYGYRQPIPDPQFSARRDEL